MVSLPVTAIPTSATLESAPWTGTSSFIGRQPIYDRDYHLIAYELLFRAGDTNVAEVVDGDEATFRVMLNAMVEMGLDQLVGASKAFLNVTRNSVLCEFPQFFPKERIVLEVLEDVLIDDELVARLRKYAEQGYAIALDDFVFAEQWKPLLELATIIKLDVQVHSEASLREHAARYSNHELLAEKVETRAQFELCRELGFQYFQGYYLSRPRTLAIRHVPTSQLPVLHILSRILTQEPTVREVAELVSQDLALSVRLLRAAQARTPRLGGRVETIDDAVAALGIEGVKSWVTLLSLSGFEVASLEHSAEALARGRACELLAPRGSETLKKRFFLVGLLSKLGDLMDMPLPVALEGLPLTEEVTDALLKHSAILGETLEAVLGRGSGRPCPFPASEIRDAVLAGQAWASSARSEIGY